MELVGNKAECFHLWSQNNQRSETNGLFYGVVIQTTEMREKNVEFGLFLDLLMKYYCLFFSV